MTTQHAVILPALDGRDPLGYLAALGLLHLLTEEAGDEVALSFSDSTAQAILHGPYAGCKQIAERLKSIVDEISSDCVLPRVPAGFPIRGGQKGGDPMRCDRQDYPALVETARTIGGEPAVSWLSVLVTDLGEDDKGRAALTPFMAPAGKMTVRSFFEKSLTLVRAQPQHLLWALTSWRRVVGFTGEYFDHRVIRNAAAAADGTPAEVGVPGATWLATMALPLLRLTGDGTHPTATLWRRAPGMHATMVWPLWSHARDRAAVTSLIEHPALTVSPVPNRSRAVDAPVQVSTRDWAALGIFAVAAARRFPVQDKKFAGVLTPISATTAS